jgi:hypothetical protein
MTIEAAGERLLPIVKPYLPDSEIGGQCERRVRHI